MTRVDENRVIALESRLTHQERMIEDMSDIVARQADAIDRLSVQVRRLQERLRDLAAGWQSSPQDDKPPPHY